MTKLANIYTKSGMTISVDELISSIKEDKKQITNLRKLEYKSLEYDKAKKSLQAFMPHGYFTSISKDSIVDLSGFLFYDIDNLSLDEITCLKSTLIEFGANLIYLSPSGMGLHFLIKVGGLTITNFELVHKTIFEYLISLGIKVDKQAGGLARKTFISYDEDVYYNDKANITIHNNEISIKQNTTLPLIFSLDSLNQSNQIKKQKETEIKGNVVFSVIPISQLKETLHFKTPIDIEGDFNIKEIEYVNILLPKIINDGDKHSLFRRIIIDLMFLNTEITLNEVYSYIYWINQTRTTKKMEYITLQKFVYNMFNWVKENKIKPFMKNKKIHISNEYTPEQKAALGGKINAKLRQNETIRLITEAKSQLELENKKQTKVNVAKLTGLSVETVRRNWNKEITDIKDIQLPEKIDDKQIEIDYKLSQLVEIDENDWFDNWQPKSRYIEKSIEDEDFGEADGINGFIETIDL